MSHKPSITSLDAATDAYLGTRSLRGIQPAELKGQGGNILLIGAGDVVNAMAGSAILQQFKKIYIYDPKVKSARDLPEGIRPYAVADRDRFIFLNSLEEVAQLKEADKLNVDFAYIASPPKFHAAGMDFCIDHGINFACEKPHFQNPVEAKRITDKLARSSVKGLFLDWMPYKEEAVNRVFRNALFNDIPYPATVKGKERLEKGNEEKGRLEMAIEGKLPFNIRDVAKITHRFTEGGADVLAVRHDTPKGGGSLEDNMVHILTALGVKGVNVFSLDDVTLAEKTNHPGIYKPIGNNDNTTGENYAHYRGTSDLGTELDLLVAKFAEPGRDEWNTTYEFKDGSKLTFDYRSGKLTYADKLKLAEDSITVNFDPYALAFHDVRHLMASLSKTGYQEEALHTVKAIEAMHDVARAKAVDATRYIAMYNDTPNPDKLPIGSVTLGEDPQRNPGGEGANREAKSRLPKKGDGRAA